MSSLWVTMGKKTYLIDDRVEDFSAKQIPRYSELSVDQADRGIVWVIHIEAGEMKHVVWEQTLSVNDDSI